MNKEPAQGNQLQDHGGVDPGDQAAVGVEDGGLRLPEEVGGEHAQEAGRSDRKKWCLYKILMCTRL